MSELSEFLDIYEAKLEKVVVALEEEQKNSPDSILLKSELMSLWRMKRIFIESRLEQISMPDKEKKTFFVVVESIYGGSSTFVEDKPSERFVEAKDPVDAAFMGLLFHAKRFTSVQVFVDANSHFGHEQPLYEWRKPI